MLTVTPKRFTLEEYHRLGELGFFAEGERVELIRGEIIKMPLKKTPHSVCNTLLWKALYKLLGDTLTLRVQEPIILPVDSEPQPDLVIVNNKDDDYLANHPYPEDILLVIEISDATLKYDQDTKLSLYAEDGIKDYWIFNLVDNHLEVYNQPYQKKNGKFSYRSKQIYLTDEQVKLPSFSDTYLDLSLVFPDDSLPNRKLSVEY